MLVDEKIYQAFLEEMQQIEKFRSSHSALFGDTPLDSGDPYTQRLIEAMAFFGGRSRIYGMRTLMSIHERLFRQYFPYLVNPLPAIGMIQVTPSIRYPQKIVLPMGSELLFKTSSHLKASFQTLNTLEVFPLFPKKFEFKRNEGRSWRCILEYDSPHVSTEEIGTFKLYINHLNNFFTSLRVSFAMQRCLDQVQVFYDTPQAGLEGGQECKALFGMDHEESLVFRHEVEKIRALLHLPQQELFLSFRVPKAGKRWKTVTFCLDLNEEWPESLTLNSESLLPFIVPVVNFKKAYADPIVCDGTQEIHPILYPEPTAGCELHTVLSVAEILAQGAKTLKPGILGLGGESYEVDYFNQTLSLELPTALNKPKTVAIEALWTQSWFSNYLNDELELQYTEAQNFGLGVRLLGSLQRHEITLEDDSQFLVRILSLKNQNQLNLNEILFILNAMKRLNQSYFDNVPEWIQDLKVHQRIDKKSYSSVIEYEFFLKDSGGQRWEVGLLFFKYVHRMLSSWLPNFEIEIKIYFPQFKKALLIKQGKDHELSTLARNFFLSQ